MKITFVVDNYVPISTPRPFLGEHGFSLLIETKTAKILLDTGQSSTVVKNLSLLGIHPDQLDAIVISHGHYDHAGGLAYILQQRSKPLRVYGHPDIFKAHYSRAGGKNRFIGIPFTKENLTSLGAQWTLSDKPLIIDQNIMLSGQIPRNIDYEVGDSNLIALDQCGCVCSDDLNDDISLYYCGEEGLIVIGGCTHSGLVNTVEHGLKLAGKTKLQGWIGGTHLGPVLKTQQDSTLKQIEKYSPDFLAAGHCTGLAMMSELQNRLQNRFIPGFVSQTIQVD